MRAWSARRRAAALTVVAALFLTGCGTTVTGRAGESALGQGDLSQASGVATGANVSGGTALGGDGSVAGDQATPGLGGAETGSLPVSGQALAGAAGATSLPPVTVGLEYVNAGDGAAAAGAIGVKGISAGDDAGSFRILFDEINRKGGLAGRKVKTVFASYDPTGSDPATQEQAICDTFTQDNKVEVALLVATASEGLRSCLAKKGVATISAGLGAMVDEKTFRASPLFATSGTLSLDRMAAVYVDGLWAQGYFGSNPTIGLVTAEEGPFTRTADGAFRQALRRHGLTVAKEQRVPSAYTVGGYGGAAPSVQSAVLTFRAANVTHVMFLQPIGAAALLFMLSADSQQYRPRYGMSTNDQLQNVAMQVPTSQLEGALAVGWSPAADVPTSTFPLSAAAKACLALLARHGDHPGEQSAVAGTLMICDQVAVLAAASTQSVGGLRTISGIERLGSSVASAAYLGLSYGAGRRDGISLVAGAAYAVPCSCFRYSSLRLRP